MNRLITTCFLSFLTFSLIAQRNSEQRYDSKLTIDLAIEDKKEHTLFIGCKEGECDIYWNDQLLTSEHTFEAAVDFIIPIKNEDYPNLFLIPIYNGDGCPSKYKILQIPDKKTFWLTNVFGNCNNAEYSTKKKVMTLSFEGLNEPDMPVRPKQTYSYNLKKGELEKVE